MPRSYSYRRTSDAGNNSNNGEYSDPEEDSECLDSGDEEEDDDAVDQAFLTKERGYYEQKSSLEFDQDKMSKADVLKRLVFCVLMLNATFVTWGVLQV